MIEKKKRPYNLKSAIRSALRKLWLYSPLRREALASARVSRGVYKCQNPKCGRLVGPKGIEVDHIKKCTPPNGINEPEDWGTFIKNLLYCGPEGIRALCKDVCHAKKTKEEKDEVRTQTETKKKTKRKTKRVRISRNVRVHKRRT